MNAAELRWVEPATADAAAGVPLPAVGGTASDQAERARWLVEARDVVVLRLDGDVPAAVAFSVT